MVDELIYCQQLIRALHEAAPSARHFTSQDVPDVQQSFLDLQARLAFASMPTALSLAEYPSAAILLSVVRGFPSSTRSGEVNH